MLWDVRFRYCCLFIYVIMHGVGLVVSEGDCGGRVVGEEREKPNLDHNKRLPSFQSEREDKKLR